jgi:hypothetical protein
MIYLFDDDKYGQMARNYAVNYSQELLNYTSVIRHFNVHAYGSIEEVLATASAILIHTSFPEKYETDLLMAQCKNRRIPLVEFSNQYSGTVYSAQQNTSVVKIKKDRMYYNLLPFVEHYRETGKISLTLLVLGKNYEAEKSLILQHRLMMHLYNVKHDFDYARVFDIDSTPYHELKELCYFAMPESNFDEMEETFADLNVQQMRAKINELVHKIRIAYDQ